MKKLFFFAAAALALASCSNDETVAQYQGEAISFRPFVGNVTRAADVTTSNLQSFTATAYNNTQSRVYFLKETFTATGTVGSSNLSTAETYNSATKHYWPATDQLDFFAYAFQEASVSQVTIGANDYTTFEVTPAVAANSQQIDLVFAHTKNQTKEANSSGVQLNFRHTGSKIAIKVKNTESNLKFQVTGWGVGYLDGTATFTYADATTGTATHNSQLTGGWSNNATPSASTFYSHTFDAVNVAASETTAKYVTSTGAEDENINMILIPQTTTAVPVTSGFDGATASANLTGSYIAVQLTILNNDDNSTIQANTWAIWPVAYTWVPGKKYTYTVDLGGGGYFKTNDTDVDLDPILENAVIKFVTVNVDDWSDASGVDVAMP